MTARNTICIASAVLAGLLIGGCHKEEPPAPAAQSQPGIISLPSHEGQGYVGTLLQSRDMAKLASSKQNLKNIEYAITMYSVEKGTSPASLEELVKAGSIVDAGMISPGDPKKVAKYIYLPAANHKGEDILVYDPVSYGGQVPFLAVDGSVKSIDAQEFERRLKAIGD
jgi:hypothetical protein